MSGRRFLLLFVVYVAAGGFVLSLPWVEQSLVAPWTRLNARGTAAIARVLGIDAEAHGADVFYGWGSLRIVVGCNGVEALLILTSAVLAFPAPWRQRALGVTAGTVAILGVNLVRLVNLVVVAKVAPTWLPVFHVYVWQVLIVLVAVSLFLTWGTYVARRGRIAGA